jgi:hypothetical protein
VQRVRPGVRQILILETLDEVTPAFVLGFMDIHAANRLARQLQLVQQPRTLRRRACRQQPISDATCQRSTSITTVR